MELAIATQTAPASWWEEDDRTIATALDVLEEIQKAQEAAARRPRRR